MGWPGFLCALAVLACIPTSPSRASEQSFEPRFANTFPLPPPISVQQLPQVEFAPARRVYVQVGSFFSAPRADELAASLAPMTVRIVSASPGGRTVYRVQIGPLRVEDALERGQSLGFSDGFIVSLE